MLMVEMSAVEMSLVQVSGDRAWRMLSYMLMISSRQPCVLFICHCIALNMSTVRPFFRKSNNKPSLRVVIGLM